MKTFGRVMAAAAVYEVCCYLLAGMLALIAGGLAILVHQGAGDFWSALADLVAGRGGRYGVQRGLLHMALVGGVSTLAGLVCVMAFATAFEGRFRSLLAAAAVCGALSAAVGFMLAGVFEVLGWRARAMAAVLTPAVPLVCILALCIWGRRARR